MSAFITLTDYKPAVHAEILDAIIRQDAATLEMAEDRAIAFMKSYLRSRYDVDVTFAKSGTDRDDLILMLAIDITLYFLYKSVNRMRTPQGVIDAWNTAKEWLVDVQNGDVVPDLPTVSDPVTGETDINNPIQYGSNPQYGTGW